ncbi:unnamed protein product [Acanthoscelides obtectus]|uniref:Uncharacterized protein n=1 Tax=Acanthoscelides obtectus TaxID=200917 RepID=A0A9P0PU25_ACAOB|nr:unnamed protein product [Acanthoscelides obtectus]CAK1656855.1 hypothetical protein AOBTE_LOCUS19967 [Acanthoscelides obtectus]
MYSWSLGYVLLTPFPRNNYKFRFNERERPLCRDRECSHIVNRLMRHTCK